jgi:hypothetical protein
MTPYHPFSERLTDALRAEAAEEDLGLDPTGLRAVAYGKRADGSLYELGSVDLACSLQVGAPGLRAMLDRVKFGARP